MLVCYLAVFVEAYFCVLYFSRMFFFFFLITVYLPLRIKIVTNAKAKVFISFFPETREIKRILIENIDPDPEK